MNLILIGKVSARPNAREHLDVHGRAYCGAGRGITAAATRWRVDGTVVTDRVCRRCLKTLRRLLAEAATAGDQYASDAAYFLEPAGPARAAADVAMISSIRATVRAAAVPPATPLERSGLDPEAYRRRLLAELDAQGGYEELAA
jgi:hypothetical protein